MAAPSPPIRVLFVCMGNICRSPAAEIVFRHMVREAGLDGAVHIDSAGTIGFHAGRGPDPRMAETLRRRGYPIAGRARQVTSADLHGFDLVLAADAENLRDLRRLDRDRAVREGVVRLLVEFCRGPHPGHVPDPYYGGAAGFEEVADLVEDACAGLLESIRARLETPASPELPDHTSPSHS